MYHDRLRDDMNGDRELQKLMRDAAPEIRPPDEHRRRLRMQLNHNFRYHRPRRLRTTTVAVTVLIVAALSTTRFTDTGSNNWDLERTGRFTVTGQEVLEAPFGSGHTMIQGLEGESGALATADFWREMHLEAYEVSGISGLGLGGEYYLRLLGKPREVSDQYQGTIPLLPEFQATHDRIMKTLRPVWQQVVLRDDEFQYVGTRTVTLGGYTFDVTIRRLAFAEVGEVYKYNGVLVE